VVCLLGIWANASPLVLRRRGEVDRAIRIHQNIIARPNLDKAQRDLALFALASDYLKAGLFDRAEKLFLQLSAVTGQRQAAMKRLVRIYEQQKDWAQAIEVRKKLGAVQMGNDDGGVAHAYCEMAQAALQKGDLNGARGHLRKARTSDRELIRSAYMRAQVAEQQEEFRAGIKLCRWIIENDASFAVEVLPLLLRSLRAVGGEALVDKTLRTMLAKNTNLQPALGVAALMHDELDSPVLLDSTRSVVLQTPFATRLVEAVQPQQPDGDAIFAAESTPSNLELGESALKRIAPVLRELILSRAKYECRGCGYAGNVLYWQCPGCKDWDSTRPVMSLLGST